MMRQAATSAARCLDLREFDDLGRDQARGDVVFVQRRSAGGEGRKALAGLRNFGAPEG
jgi:hypothetical protein